MFLYREILGPRSIVLSELEGPRVFIMCRNINSQCPVYCPVPISLDSYFLRVVSYIGLYFIHNSDFINS